VIDDALQWITGVLAVPVAMGFLCRIGMLSLREHSTSVAVMHACMFAGALYALFRATGLQASLGDLAFVAGSGLWLSVSMHSWAGGVPRHFSRTMR
jgi:hypothetical protein